MFQFQGIWLPDGERHFAGWMEKNGELVDGKGTYQIRKLRAALEHCRNLRVAVDVGAHVGLWSMQLVKHFHTVHAFEPVASFRECFERNVPRMLAAPMAVLYPVALGAERGNVVMKIPALDGGLDTGGTHVGHVIKDTAFAADHHLDAMVEMRALDEYDFSDVDLIKVDCEGFEHHVIAGARETLLRCRPCVIVEQKPHKLGPNFGINGTPAVDLLVQMGAFVRREIGGDFILSW